jgi:predicted site-specific integrase-resolvase
MRALCDLPGADAFGRLNRKAAAEALGFAPATLANWATKNYGPPVYRAGGKTYYLASEVRDFALSDARKVAQ